MDLLNGQRIDVGKSLAWSNDKEYHHFFPQAYLRRMRGNPANVVGNIVLLTSMSNIDILDSAPSEYLGRIMADSGRDALLQRLASNLVPESALDAALADDYPAFLDARSEFLHAHLERLTGPIAGVEDVGDDADDDSDVDATD